MSEVRLAFEATLLAVLRSRELFSTIILAVLLYGFYYPAPYAHQTVQSLPIVVVDDEDSAITREIVRDLSDAREVHLTAVLPDMAAAQSAVRERRADGILFFSHDFTRRLISGGGSGGVGIWVNGAYLLRARDIGAAIMTTIQGVAEHRLGPAAQSLGLVLPAKVVVRPLFNTREGYKDYVFPAVAIIILQQTLLFGAATFMAERRERGAWQTGHAEFFGMWAAFTLIGTLAALLYFGMIFWVQDVPRGGHLALAIIGAPIFASAVAALGLLLGSFTDRGYRAMQILVPTSVPLFFLTGAAWPLDMMPGWLSLVAHLSPATSGVHLFVRINQMGAYADEVVAPFASLLLVTCLFGTASFLRLTLPRKGFVHE